MCIVSHHNISLGITNQGSISIAFKKKKKSEKAHFVLIEKAEKSTLFRRRFG